MASCGNSWSSTSSLFDGRDPAEGRRQFDTILDGLADRGWKEVQAAAPIPIGEDSSAVTAVYRKRGWTLHARFNSLGAFQMSTVKSTEDAFFDQFTLEELELLESTL